MKNKYSFIALIIFLFVGPFLFPNATITEMLIFGIVAISTNIMLGYTGMLSFGQALFFGTSGTVFIYVPIFYSFLLQILRFFLEHQGLYLFM